MAQAMGGDAVRAASRVAATESRDPQIAPGTFPKTYAVG